MSSDSMNMDWLSPGNLKSVTARRFADFCRQELEKNNDPDDPDNSIYKEAAALVVERIEKSVVGEVQ